MIHLALITALGPDSYIDHSGRSLMWDKTIFVGIGGGGDALFPFRNNGGVLIWQNVR